MDLEKAQSALRYALASKKEWTREVARLRELIAALGGDPDEERTLRSFRDEEIYTMFLQQVSYPQIAQLMQLSVSRVKEIAQREKLKARHLMQELIRTNESSR